MGIPPSTVSMARPTGALHRDRGRQQTAGVRRRRARQGLLAGMSRVRRSSCARRGALSECARSGRGPRSVRPLDVHHRPSPDPATGRVNRLRGPNQPALGADNVATPRSTCFLYPSTYTTISIRVPQRRSPHTPSRTPPGYADDRSSGLRAAGIHDEGGTDTPGALGRDDPLGARRRPVRAEDARPRAGPDT